MNGPTSCTRVGVQGERVEIRAHDTRADGTAVPVGSRRQARAHVPVAADDRSRDGVRADDDEGRDERPAPSRVHPSRGWARPGRRGAARSQGREVGRRVDTSVGRPATSSAGDLVTHRVRVITRSAPAVALGRQATAEDRYKERDVRCRDVRALPGARRSLRSLCAMRAEVTKSHRRRAACGSTKREGTRSRSACQGRCVTSVAGDITNCLLVRTGRERRG